MIALILNNDIVVGYNVDIAACIASGANFIEVEELPQSWYDLQANQQIRLVNGEFVVESLPPPPISEIDQLKQQVQQLTTTLGDFILGGL